jgi:hypothetical protein
MEIMNMSDENSEHDLRPNIKVMKRSNGMDAMARDRIRDERTVSRQVSMVKLKWM